MTAVEAAAKLESYHGRSTFDQPSQTSLSECIQQLVASDRLTALGEGRFVTNPKREPGMWQAMVAVREGNLILASAKGALPKLQKLLQEASDHWGYEDQIYRFYHHSFKVYHIQKVTLRIVTALRALAPHLPLNAWFREIVGEGTGKVFDLSHNERWLFHTRPMVEAFFHARYMLEMVCRYAAKLDHAPRRLPSGWAAVLCLYDLR